MSHSKFNKLKVGHGVARYGTPTLWIFSIETGSSSKIISLSEDKNDEDNESFAASYEDIGNFLLFISYWVLLPQEFDVAIFHHSL